MTLSYRRQSLDRDTTFYIPKVECFACYDSGIVTNGDAAINQYIPDYDRTADGKINGGHNFNIIADEVSLSGTARAYTEENRSLIKTRMKENAMRFTRHPHF